MKFSSNNKDSHKPRHLLSWSVETSGRWGRKILAIGLMPSDDILSLWVVEVRGLFAHPKGFTSCLKDGWSLTGGEGMAAKGS